MVVVAFLFLISYLRYGVNPFHVAAFRRPVQSKRPVLGEQNAVATFLAGRWKDDWEEDRYFTATRVMAYQLLHQPTTRTQQNISFLVLVTPYVSKAKRKVLEAEGCTVIPVDLIEPEGPVNPLFDRWIDMFSKLHLFRLTEYNRILYLDNDHLVTQPLDGIFDEEVVQTVVSTDFNDSMIPEDEPRPPETFVLAGVGDNFDETHSYPPEQTDYLNAGFFVLRPDLELFEYYKKMMNLPDKYDQASMEQNMLNYVHRWAGPMPWQTLPPGKWNCNYPTVGDLEGGAATLHDKFWEYDNRDWIDRTLVEMWWRVQGQMEGFWQKDRAQERLNGFWSKL